MRKSRQTERNGTKQTKENIELGKLFWPAGSAPGLYWSLRAIRIRTKLNGKNSKWKHGSTEPKRKGHFALQKDIRIYYYIKNN